MKHTNRNNRSSQLRSTIKQATDLATQKCAAFDRELSLIRSELQKAKEDAAAAKAELARGEPTPEFIATVKAFRGRKEFLRLKVESLEAARDAALEAKDNLLALRVEEVEEEERGALQRMRGLLSYGIATGQSTSDSQLLYDSIGDFLEATTDSDRKKARKTVNLIFQHGNIGPKRDNADAGDEILRQLEAITNPEEQSHFYSKHQQEILGAFENRNRKNNP